tara:strand:+ start:4829 stop:6226 length:1398 start_codon:yes stop_codon:yes gene_type:complete
MASVIAAPSSNSGKTILNILISSWAFSKGIKIQTFKVGPDYLDSQLLSVISQKPCHNLDLILTNKEWVTNCFQEKSSSTDLSVVEGVMGLFDGIGSTRNGSTADIARHLNLPIILTINASGQGASIRALVKGFRDQDKELKFAGVVLNQVNSERHKRILKEVLEDIGVEILGIIPKDDRLKIPSRHLGLIQHNEINDIKSKVEVWKDIAKQNLNLNLIEKLLRSPRSKIEIFTNPDLEIKNISKSKTYPIAIAQDEAFNFCYPEFYDYLESSGFELIKWEPLSDQAIPYEAKGLIIPGGFPEIYAEQLSNAKNTLDSIKYNFNRIPIYAECGGMLLLGKGLTDSDNNKFKMAGILPFNSKKGNLVVGYRNVKFLSDTLIARKGNEFIGHEFHYWETFKERTLSNTQSIFLPPWEKTGWGVKLEKEGYSNNMLHASWVHLHWPCNKKIIERWKSSITENEKRKSNS